MQMRKICDIDNKKSKSGIKLQLLLKGKISEIKLVFCKKNLRIDIIQMVKLIRAQGECLGIRSR